MKATEEEALSFRSHTYRSGVDAGIQALKEKLFVLPTGKRFANIFWEKLMSAWVKSKRYYVEASTFCGKYFEYSFNAVVKQADEGGYEGGFDSGSAWANAHNILEWRGDERERVDAAWWVDAFEEMAQFRAKENITLEEVVWRKEELIRFLPYTPRPLTPTSSSERNDGGEDGVGCFVPRTSLAAYPTIVGVVGEQTPPEAVTVEEIGEAKDEQPNPEAILITKEARRRASSGFSQSGTR